MYTQDYTQNNSLVLHIYKNIFIIFCLLEYYKARATHLIYY